MKFSLGSSWSKKLKGRVEGYDFEVGVLEEKPHFNPVDNGLLGQPVLSSYAGGPVRKMSREPGEATIGEVLVDNMKRLNINILQRPFQEKNSDILKFSEAFLRFVLKRSDASIKRVENLLQAIVRNPILRGEYGDNSPMTVENKGFNRHLFDTGQMFKNIKAKARKK